MIRLPLPPPNISSQVIVFSPVSFVKLQTDRGRLASTWCLQLMLLQKLNYWCLYAVEAKNVISIKGRFCRSMLPLSNCNEVYCMLLCVAVSILQHMEYFQVMPSKPGWVQPPTSNLQTSNQGQWALDLEISKCRILDRKNILVLNRDFHKNHKIRIKKLSKFPDNICY